MKSLSQRFEEKYQAIPWSGCWIWTAGVDEYGYGVIKAENKGNKKYRAHRVSYELYRSKIPEGLVLDHICRTPSCVNPDHLKIVTLKENSLCGFGYMANFARRTHCNHGHEFTEENTVYRNGNDGARHRRCRTCHNEETKNYKRKLRAIK